MWINNPQEKLVNYSLISASYDGNYTSSMSIEENRFIKQHIKDYFDKDKKILDLGCGTGFIIDLLGTNDISPHNYIGIDKAKPMLMEFEKKHRSFKGRLVHGDAYQELSNLEINDRFNIITSLFSMPYLGVELIDKIEQLLKPNGLFIMVIYKRPYKNIDSVYYNRGKLYNTQVLPRVKEVITRLENSSVLKQIYKKDITKEETYTLYVYKKGGTVAWEV